MVGVREGLNLGSIPNFFLCFGMHPKIIDVHPKLIPKGGVVQFCQVVFSKATKSKSFKVSALLRESYLSVQQTGAVLICVLPINAKPRLLTAWMLNNINEDLFRVWEVIRSSRKSEEAHCNPQQRKHIRLCSMPVDIGVAGKLKSTWLLEHKTCDIMAAERLRLMRFDNRLIIDSFQEAICILKW